MNVVYNEKVQKSKFLRFIEFETLKSESNKLNEDYLQRS